MQVFKQKWFNRFFFTALGLLLMAGSIILFAPMSVWAEPTQSIEIIGDGVNKPVTFSLAQLQAMQQYQVAYSAINTWPSKKWYIGKGVKVADLLDLAELKQDARLIKFISNDGYAVTLTVQELLKDQRYCFPHFKDNSTSDGDGNIPGSPAGAKLVEPIIALVSVEGSDNPNYMNDLNSCLFMMGQRAVTEQSGNLFVKYLSKIEVLTSEPEKWDNPQANPAPGVVPAGTMVALNNIHMDDDKVYYTTDGSTPTVNSTIYNWIAKRWWGARADVLGNYNKPIGPINENTVIKAVTIGPGKLNSDVVTFSYQITAATNLAIEPANQLQESKTDQPVNLTDIKSHWAQKSIEELVSSGTVGGYPDGTFKPNNTITRAEFATMLVKAFQLENKGGKVFADTAAHWASDYIATATANGIVNGYDQNTFGPNDLITREQMAVMIVKASQLAFAPVETQFADSDSVSVWAREAITSATGNGIMKGYPDNTIRPQGNATRAEAVTMIMNALHK